jgi:hypothetical protein
MNKLAALAALTLIAVAVVAGCTSPIAADDSTAGLDSQSLQASQQLEASLLDESGSGDAAAIGDMV